MPARGTSPRFGDTPEDRNDFNYPEEAVFTPSPAAEPADAKKEELSRLKRKAKWAKWLATLQLTFGLGSFPGMFGFSIVADTYRDDKPPELELKLTSDNFSNALGGTDAAHMSRIEQETLRSKVLQQFIRLQQRIATAHPSVALQQLRAQLDVAIPAFSEAQIEGTDALIRQANDLLKGHPEVDQARAIDTYISTFTRWVETVGRQKYGLNNETVAFMQTQVRQYRERMDEVLGVRDTNIKFYRDIVFYLLLAFPILSLSGMFTNILKTSLQNRIRIKEFEGLDVEAD